MRKKLFALAIVVICAAIAAMGTIAYFTTSETTTNVITTGKVDIALGTDVTNVKDIPVVMPGVTLQQPVTVTNQPGAAEAYIRVKVEVELTKAGETTAVSPEELAGLVTLTSASGDWVGKGGWWYYTKNNGVLAATPADAADAERSSTTPLQLNIRFSGSAMGNEYQNAAGKIRVYAQAVQVKNNPGETALSAMGWPEESQAQN